MTKVAVVTIVPESFRVLLRAQIEHIRAAGFEVHCVCSPGSYVHDLARDGFVVHQVSLTRLLRPVDDLRAIITLTRLFRAQRFALVHTHTPKAALLGQLAARIAGVPHIVNTVHGLLGHDGVPILKRSMLEVIDRLTCALSTALLSQSREDVSRAVRRLMCRKEKIRAVGQGIDLGRFDPDRFDAQRRRILRKQFGLPETAIVVAMVARFTREKGYPEFFEMARHVSAARTDVHFLVVGATLDERDPIDPDPERQGLAGRMTLLKDRRDMPEIYACADIVVLPTYREGFPRSLVEAAAMGLPVVSTKIRGCREAVADGETGLLVRPGDVTALSEAVEMLLREGAARARMSKATRQRALREFDEPAVCERVLTLYDELLGGRKMRAGDSIGCTALANG